MFASAFDPQQGWSVATELPLVRDEGGGKIRSRSRSAAMSDSVKIRNARERERVKTLNFAYEKLRDRLPLTPGLRGKKLSKYETLQNAIEYIHTLEDLLNQSAEEVEGIFPRPQGNIELRKCMPNGSPLSSHMQITGAHVDMTVSSSRSSESGFSSNDSNASQAYGSIELSEADCLVKQSSGSMSICKQEKENLSEFSQGIHPMYAVNPVAMSLAASYYAQNTGHSAGVNENEPDPYSNLQQQSPYPQSEEYESASFDTQEHVTFKNLNYQAQELKNHFPIHMAADIKTESPSYESTEPISFGTYE